MKLAVIFEVPDDQADAYADVAARLIQHHAFAAEQKIEHWSFHQEMRPISAVSASTMAELIDVFRDGVLRQGMIDAAYGEASREDWARTQVAEAGKSWDTHLAKFDGTVLER